MGILKILERNFWREVGVLNTAMIAFAGQQSGSGPYDFEWCVSGSLSPGPVRWIATVGAVFSERSMLCASCSMRDLFKNGTHGGNSVLSANLSNGSEFLDMAGTGTVP